MASPDHKRVLISAPLYANGGIEAHLFSLCRLLVEHGAEVTLVSRYARRSIRLVQQHRQIPIRLYTTPFAESGGLASTLWATLAWPLHLLPRFDVLHTLDVSPFVNFLALFLKPGGYLIGGRAGIVPPVPGFVEPRVQRKLDGFLVEADALAEKYQLDIPIAVIPHLGNVRCAAERQRRPVDELQVVFLGRLHADKGVFRLLEIWPRLNIQPAHLHFHGDGPERASLEQAIRDRNLLSRATVHGAAAPEELPAIFDRADLLVLPSAGEGLPLVLMESMAYGVPFVATDVGAIRSLARDNPDVSVVPLSDAALQLGIERMARAIRSGQIDGRRLQQYHRERYGYDLVASRWLQALLHPEEFWKSGGSHARDGRECRRDQAQEPVGGGVRA